MERAIGTDTIILLLDQCSRESRYLYESIERAGYDCLAIVLEEDDFLPENIISVYDMLSGDWKKQEKGFGKPRFFNEIAVPDHWSISAGVGESCGKIVYQSEVKARIYYAEPVRKYLVKSVDWMNRRGAVRFRDHYNRYGNVCARTFYHADGKPLSKSWFSANEREILVENYVTGDITYNDGELMKHFRTKMELLSYFFLRMGFERNRIFYNSLSMPFEVVHNLGSAAARSRLFWQEPVGDTIMEKLRLFLDGREEHIGQVVVQNRRSYDGLVELGANENKLCRMGYIYPFEKENGHRAEALICTNSDQIEHCRELIRAFPQMHFHIAAITLMSPALMSLGNFPNVSLYPGIELLMQKELFKKCDYYFDINYYGEIISAVHTAFLHNQLIFAFRETVHNRDCVPDTHIYAVSEFERMVLEVRRTLEDRDIMEQELQKQREYALTENREAYIGLIEGI